MPSAACPTAQVQALSTAQLKALSARRYGRADLRISSTALTALHPAQPDAGADQRAQQHPDRFADGAAIDRPVVDADRRPVSQPASPASARRPDGGAVAAADQSPHPCGNRQPRRRHRFRPGRRPRSAPCRPDTACSSRSRATQAGVPFTPAQIAALSAVDADRRSCPPLRVQRPRRARRLRAFSATQIDGPERHPDRRPDRHRAVPA